MNINACKFLDVWRLPRAGHRAPVPHEANIAETSGAAASDRLERGDTAQRGGFRALGKVFVPAIFRQKHPQLPSVVALVAAINRPHWRIENSDRIEAALTHVIERRSGDAEPLLWRGILRRIIGAANARSDLAAVLAREPDNRLAILNLAALPITCLDVRLHKGEVGRSLALIDSYVQARPDDYFGLLIQATLTFLASHSSMKLMEALEGLYVRFPNRSPTASLMASLQQKNGRRASASDFAREAVRLNPHDAVAHNIIETNLKRENPKHRATIRQMPQAIADTSFDVVFMAPYAQQDVHEACSGRCPH